MGKMKEMYAEEIQSQSNIDYDQQYNDWSKSTQTTEKQFEVQEKAKMAQFKQEIKAGPAVIVYRGIVVSLTNVTTTKQKSGTNWRIKFDNGEYVYYNSSANDDSVVKKLFQVNQEVLFTINEKPNRAGVVYKIVSQILFKF